MRALGFDVKKADVLKVLHEYDREESGTISFEDYNDCSKRVIIICIIMKVLEIGKLMA